MNIGRRCYWYDFEGDWDLFLFFLCSFSSLIWIMGGYLAKNSCEVAMWCVSMQVDGWSMAM